MPSTNEHFSTLKDLPDIQYMGILIWDPIWAQKDHADHRHELVYIMKGDVVMHQGKNRYKGTDGDFLFNMAHTVHRDDFPLNKIFKAFVVHFFWDEFSSLFSHITNDDLLKLSATDKKQLSHLAMDLYTVLRENRPFAREMTNTCLFRLILTLHDTVMRNRSSKPQQKADDRQIYRWNIIENAKKFIQLHIHEPIMLMDIADELKISPYHLSHIFSQESGFTLSSYIMQMRMQEAARLLADPTKQVSEVSFACGFDDPNYFARVFRKFHHQSPVQFRAKAIATD